MRNKCYTTCIILQDDDGEKFNQKLRDTIQDIQSRGLYAEVQYNTPAINMYSALVMSYKMQ